MIPRWMARLFRVLAGLLVLAVAVGVEPSPPRVLAAVLIVTKTADTDDGACDADCSLREAVFAAESTPGADTINLPAGVFTLSNGLLIASDTLNISGIDPLATIIDGGGGNFSVLRLDQGATASVSGLTIRNGGNIFGGSGVSNFGSLTLDNVVVAGGMATAERAAGAGIYNTGTLALHNTAIRNNRADNQSSGAAIFNQAGTITITSSEISGNTGWRSVAIHNQGGGSVSLTSVTMSGNSAQTGPGLLINVIDSTFQMMNVTIAGNVSAAGGVIGAFGTVTIKNSIVAGNTPNNCSGAVVSQGHNISSDATCPFSGPGDLMNTDPLLGPLSDNGGPTLTHSLAAGSAAIDAGDNVGCPAVDQRGVARPQVGGAGPGAVCDIGSLEKVVLPLTHGDVDCNGLIDSVDALKDLRAVAGLSVAQAEPCPDPASTLGMAFSDVDCSGVLDAVDGLKIARYVAALPVAQNEPCPDVGLPVD